MATPAAVRFGLRQITRSRLTAYTVDPETLGRYARDPFAHVEDGHVWIPHVETKQDVVFEPTEQQYELGRAWVDVDYLVRTGVPRWRDVHEEKSRQLGMTWLLAWLETWALTYFDLPGLYLNMDAAEVDDGGEGNTTESFFGKIRYIRDRMPQTYRAPLRFRGGNNPSVRNRLRSRAVLVGEGATPNPGRGGTYARAIADEAARMPYGKAAFASLSRACPTGKLFNSTPKGEDNEYARLREARPKGWTFLRHHWSGHPIYGAGAHVAGTLNSCPLCRGNQLGIPWDPSDPQSHRYVGKLTSPWYDDAVLELTDEQVASELDIEYAASLAARVYEEFSEEVHVLDEIPYDEALGPPELAIDYGLDVTAVAFLQDGPDAVRQIGELEIGDADPDEVAAAIREIAADLGVPLLLLRPEWTRTWRAIGDPAGEARSLSTGRPLVTEYRRNGFEIVSKPYPVSTTIVATKRLLLGRPKPFRISKATCPETIRHFRLNEWPTDRDGNRKPGATAPKDDRHNHMMRAIAYYTTFRFPPPATFDETPVANDVYDPDDLASDLGHGESGTYFDPDLGF